MSAEADLLAAIVAAPDDPAGFLVYADFLQSRNDPRGELITLMHAGEHDKEKAALAEKLVRANKTAFLGRLDKHPSVKLEAWRLGFVDHVRLIADDEKHAALLIDEVVDHPSCLFMRTLEVKILGKRRSYAGVDARLVELARPQTLTKVVFGKPGDHVFSTALAETFPHIGAAPKRSWEDVASAVHAVRRGVPNFGLVDLAPVTTSQGNALPLTPQDLLRGLGGEVDGKQPIGLVAQLLDDCAPDVLDRYGASLVTAWTLAGEEPRTAWAYDVASMLGGARVASAIGRRIAGVSPARASHAIDCLARMRSPLATLELYAISRHWATRGEQAEAALAAMARRTRVDVLTLLARAGSDPRDAFDDDTFARFRELDHIVLEHLMVSGWSVRLSTAVDLFARAPRHAWSKWLLWRVHDRSHERPTHEVFAFDAKGPTDVEGHAIDLAPDTPVSIAHIADAPRTIDAWREWQRALHPPFEQLERQALPMNQVDELVSWNMNIETLRRRTYRNGGLKNELHEEQRFVKTHLYRGTAYTLAVMPEWGHKRIVTMPEQLPPVVAFELARDLLAAQPLGE